MVQYDGCKAAQKTETKISCSSMDDGGQYFTAEQMRVRDYSAGVYNQFGDLKADTPYWILAWQPVPEKADLSRAQLCEECAMASRTTAFHSGPCAVTAQGARRPAKGVAEGLSQAWLSGV